MPRVLNWSRTQSCSPRELVQPATEAEVVELVRRARASDRRIKVVGARHSWSDIAMGEDLLVNLDRMQDLIEVDAAAGTARVQAGIRLHRLIDALAERELGLTIIGSVTEQSLAGVMSTGTHGSSLVHGNIPSFVVGLRMVAGTGEVIELREGDRLFEAARVGLGALGILTEVTIRVEPRFNLRETTESLSFAEALSSLDAIAASAEYVKLWWLPHTDAVMVFRYERTEASGRLNPVAVWIDQWIVNKLVFAALLWLGGRIRRLSRGVNRLVAKTYLDRKPRVARSDKLLALVMPPRHREMEYALPVERSAEALAAMRERVEALDVDGNFIQELRFVRADPGWMSPASERDSCQLGAYMAEAPGIDDYFAGFEADMLALGGRPHWGKEFGIRGAELRALWPHAEAFVAAIAELDPEGVFRNRFVERLLAD